MFIVFLILLCCGLEAYNNGQHELGSALIAVACFLVIIPSLRRG